MPDEIRSPRAEPRPWWERYQQFFAGLASGAVVLLAFLIPSLQDQWDRHQSRETIDRYAAIGHRLFERGLYASAEQAFSKALELSEGRRVDLLEAQLRAHVGRVNDDPEWLGAVPIEVTESDFVYLLELQDAPDKAHERAATLAAFGDFLASEGRITEAEQRLREALRLDAHNVAALVDLGNLLDDAGQVPQAEQLYRTALAAAPKDANVIYDLGVLLRDAGRCREAAPLLRERLARDAHESALWELLAECLDALAQPTEAAAARRQAQATHVEPRRARPRLPRGDAPDDPGTK